MSKERLEEIKAVNNDIKRFHDEFNHKQADIAKCYFYEKYGNWLIEQAERAQELEENNRTFRKNNKRLRKENQRYREALEYIADNKIEHGWNLKAVNCVVRARRALGESE